ncbi:hypothetical protein KUTeg_003105 [Tegillarca granosa]|uniref:EGF-like domain-containing protein n=1 Tax=Tegillarca granosa TaxID=220873 RepID=A0ABQ9FL63_TEGGR|nr:hypothetical protein KUTeg_003105 [Tegillarca granosa]
MKMFKLDMLIILSLIEVLGGISALPTLERDHKNRDMRCIFKQNTQRHSPSKQSKVPEDETERRQYCLVDESYLGLDIYPCDHFFQWSIKQECLMCGQHFHELKRKLLCPHDQRDNPSKYLTCEYCRRFANPCQNGGTAICGAKSYASELKCNCTSGYSGKFCDYAVEEVVYTCALKYNDGTALPECDGNQLTICITTFNGRHYKCNLQEDDEEVDLPRCDTVPLPVEETVEYSADGILDTDDENSKFGNLVLKPSDDDSGIFIDALINKKDSWSDI